MYRSKSLTCDVSFNVNCKLGDVHIPTGYINIIFAMFIGIIILPPSLAAVVEKRVKMILSILNDINSLCYAKVHKILIECDFCGEAEFTYYCTVEFG